MATDYDTRRIIGPEKGTGYSNGVGTPFIANHPYTNKNYFVFTGWTSYAGANRQIFVADIKEDMTLSKVRRILAWDFPGDLTADGHTTSHVTWDEHRKCWLVLSSEKDLSSPIMVVGIYRFTDDFSRLIDYTRVRPPHDSNPGPSGQTIPTTNGGAVLMRDFFEMGTSGLFFYATNNFPYNIGRPRTPIHGKLAVMHTPDYTADQIVFDYNDYVFWGGNPGVLQPLQTTSETIVVLVEDLSQQNPWTVKPVFLCGSGHYPACTQMFGVQAYGSIIPHFGTGMYHVGHPHATIHPDGTYYNLFHTIFREYEPSKRHDIWCTRILPSRLDPRSYDSFFTGVYEGSVSGDGYLSKVIPGWFASEMSVFVQSDVEGTLTILGGTEFDRIETDTASRAVAARRQVFRFNDLLPFNKIAFAPSSAAHNLNISLSMTRL